MANSMQGVLYGSPATPEAPATLLWRPFDNAQSQQWSLALPDGEEAAAVAAGRQFSAAAMSTRVLRIFAESGVLLICPDLPAMAVTAYASCIPADRQGSANIQLIFTALWVVSKDPASCIHSVDASCPRWTNRLQGRSISAGHPSGYALCAGLQTGVLALEGPPVALVGHDVLLAAVWHSGAPSIHRDQVRLLLPS